MPWVWAVDPHWQTVTVYRPKAYDVAERLPEYPPMPGFTPTVAELFD